MVLDKTDENQDGGHGARQMLNKGLFVHEWCLGKERVTF